MRVLLRYQWPGNVRELRSAIEYALIHCRGGAIEGADLPPELAGEGEAAPPHDRALAKRERILIALERAGGNRKAAAQLLGVSRATLYRHLNELGISLQS